MEFWLVIILIIIGYAIFRSITSSSKQPPSQVSDYQRRRTGRTADPKRPDYNNSLVRSAKQQETVGNFEEAARLYLQAGHVFSAAKMKALKGPNYANEAVDLIKVNASDRTELITRNLANDFYYRLNQPATAASLLRSLGLIEEAEAVEVAAGILPTQSIQEPVQTTSEAVSTAPATSASIQSTVVDEIDSSSSAETEVETASKVEKDVVGESDYPNTLLMASSTLDKNCSACRREIKSGDSFIYCLNCGHPGHYAHLGELIKVTGKCPVCKERLVSTMYNIQ